VNLYLAEAKGNGRQEWLDALDAIERLQPGAVVAGHKRDGDADSPENIGKTRRYIEDFSAAVEKAHNFTDLYAAMVAVYPGRVNRHLALRESLPGLTSRPPRTSRSPSISAAVPRT
jgi:hypothetical protein